MATELYPNHPGDKDRKPSMPTLERMKELPNGDTRIFVHGLKKQISASLWDKYFSRRQVTVVKNGVREVNDWSHEVTREIYDQCFTPIKGYTKGSPSARQKHNTVLVYFTEGDMTLMNPDSILEPGSVAVIEFVFPTTGIKLTLKIRVPNEQQQIRFDKFRQTQQTNAKGETYNAGFIVNSIELSKQLWVGAEGYESNDLPHIPPHHLHRCMAKLFQELDDEAPDEGNSDGRPKDISVH